MKEQQAKGRLAISCFCAVSTGYFPLAHQVGKSQVVDLVEVELSLYDDHIDVSPVSVVRNSHIKAFWRRSFCLREAVPWGEFWNAFPRNLEGDSVQVRTHAERFMVMVCAEYYFALVH